MQTLENVMNSMKPYLADTCAGRVPYDSGTVQDLPLEVEDNADELSGTLKRILP